MQTEQSRRRENWTSLSGKIVEGGCELKDLLEADDERARFRVRVLGDRELVATALVLRLSPEQSKRQLELWETARSLRDVHLSSPISSGVAELDGSRTAFVVVREPDESLAGVLRERALTAEEAKEAVLNLVQALEILHLNRLVMGNLSPEQVHAIGDGIKLPTDSARFAGVPPPVEIRPAKYVAPESSGHNLTAESDIWCLGATIFESLTQKRWSEGSEELDSLPEPFATIALRCLVADPARRARLAEVTALARGDIKPAPRQKTAATKASNVTTAPVPEGAIAPAGPTNGVPEKPAVAPQPALANNTGAKPDEPVVSGANGDRSKTPGTNRSSEPTEAEAKVAPGKPDGATLNPDAPRVSSAEVRTPPMTGKQPVTRTASSTLGLTSGQRPRWEDANRKREEEGQRPSRLWMWAGVAFLVVLGLLWAFRPKQPKTAQVVQPGAPGSSTTQSKGAWETKTLQPDGTASAPATPPERAAETKSAAVKTPPPTTAKVPAPKAPIAKAAPVHTEPKKTAEAAPVNGNIWRVVLYTYNREDAAAEKAKSLNARYGNLHAEVFSPSGNGGPYLVTAGGRMNRDQATQIKRRVVGQGLPRDAYIQNYSK